MRALPIAVLIVLLPFLAIPAEAQVTRSMLTIAIDPPPEAFTKETNVISVQGTTTFTGDLGTYHYMNGVPISYTVTKAPGWLSVVVSPSSDVIPLGPPSGLHVQGVRTFLVTAVLDPNFVGDAADQIEITVTQGQTTLSTEAWAKTAAPVIADVAEPCDEAHAAELLALAEQAADAYARERATGAPDATDVGAGRPGASDPELITQDTSAKPLALPWVVVAGFALVGAGVGLVLRRRLKG